MDKVMFEIVKAERDALLKMLRRLTDASEAVLSSDVDMPSHAGSEQELDAATDKARALLAEIDAAAVTS